MQLNLQTPSERRKSAVEAHFDDSYWHDADCGPDNYTIDSGYCLDAPKWLPLGFTRTNGFDLSIRPGFGRGE